MSMYKKAGFTYIELIIALLIISIVVAGVYSAFLSATKLTSITRHYVYAVSAAQSWLENVRQSSVFKTFGVSDPFTTVSAYVAANQPNVNSAPFAQLKGEVNGLSATGTPNTNINLGSGAPYTFTRADVNVNWNERSEASE